MRGVVPEKVLAALGIESGARLGFGGEATVFALNDERVARVHRPGTERATVEARAALLEELGQSAREVPFLIPSVLSIDAVEDALVTTERRLPGRALSQVLAESQGQARASLIHAYLEAAAAVGDLVIERPWFGELLAPDPLRTRTFGEFLRERIRPSLSAAGEDFAAVDGDELAAALPEPDEGRIVHLDVFPGNMMSEGGVITAILDFSVVSLVGDRRLDPLLAAVYLAPQISPEASDEDRAVAREWLDARGLGELFVPVERWSAAYWSGAVDDGSLHNWCRSVLLS
jgi:hypothetical protein